MTRHTYTLTTGTGQLDTERKALIKALYTTLENRFDYTTVVKATAIADFKMWPIDEDNLHTFGDDWMTTLLQQFSSYPDDPDQIRVEWLMLKSAVLEVFLSSSGSASWSEVNRRFGEEYPHVLSFFDLILTMPATSAACERGFNHMKLIKSHQRSAMTKKTLCDYLMIRLEGESIKDFNPDAAINYWFDVTIRRPGGSQSKKNIAEAKEGSAYTESQ